MLFRQELESMTAPYETKGERRRDGQPQRGRFTGKDDIVAA
jgi:hypothetical protein